MSETAIIIAIFAIATFTLLIIAEIIGRRASKEIEVNTQWWKAQHWTMTQKFAGAQQAKEQLEKEVADIKKDRDTRCKSHQEMHKTVVEQRGELDQLRSELGEANRIMELKLAQIHHLTSTYAIPRDPFDPDTE